MGSVQKWEFFKGQRGLDTESLPHICFANILLNVFFLSNFFCQFFLFFFFRIKFFFHLKIFEKKNFILKKKKDKKIMKKKNFSNSSKKNIRKKLTWYGTPSHLTIEILIFPMTPCFKKDILSFPFRPKNFAQTNCFFSALASQFCFCLFQAQTFFENYQASFPKKKAVESRLRFIRLLAQKRKR